MYPPPPTKMRSNSTSSATTVSDRSVWDSGASHTWYSGSWTNHWPGKFEEVSSENHAFWRRSKKSLVDLGGEFFVYRQFAQFPQPIHWHWETKVKDRKDIQDVTGIPLPNPISDLDFPHPMNSSQSKMDMWGAECVAKAAPGTSPVNMAIALGELKKDGLPSMIGATFKERTSVVKKAGDEYLNAQFGWKPLLNDVKSLAKTVLDANQILFQLERDAGRVVRRRLTLEESDESKIEDLGISFPNIGGFANTTMRETDFPNSRFLRTERRYRKVWFSGSFTYYLPDNYYSRNQVVAAKAKAALLYGLEPNPQTLWALTPWSWAADWFSNADEVISNTYRFLTDGLVMHYGYLMEHTIHSYTYEASNGCVPPVVLTIETKGRRKANPFGFGLDWSALTGYQTSILAALGMSRRG